MRKYIFAAGTALLAAGITACGGSKNAAGADSDTIVAEEIAAVEAPAAPSDTLYNAAFFDDESRKSETASDSTWCQTASGLKFTIINEGTGAQPKAEDAVTVHYTGRLTDGTVFDSSVDRGEPATFPLNRVIPGWTEGLQLMKEGGVTVFYIPSELAYGKQGAPGAIPPDAPLIFTVQLLKVN